MNVVEVRIIFTDDPEFTKRLKDFLDNDHAIKGYRVEDAVSRHDD